MATTYPRKWFTSEFQGAPACGAPNRQAGLLNNILKSCLVTGFGDTQVDALEYDEAEQAAVATIQAGHSFQKYQVIEIIADQEEYTGEHRVTKVTATQVWFELDSVPTQTVSGAITMRTPGVGWTIEHESGDGLIVIYRTKADEGDFLIRVVDDHSFGSSSTSYGTRAGVQLVSDVVDIDTFEEAYTSLWVSNTWYNNRDVSDWNIVANDKIVYFTHDNTGGNYSYYEANSMYCVGYIDSVRPGDRSHCITRGNFSETDTPYNKLTEFLNDNSYNSTPVRARLARSHTQLKGVVPFRLMNFWSLLGDGLSTPNLADNGVYLSQSDLPVLELEGSTYTYRGTLPLLVNRYHKQTNDHRTIYQNLRHDRELLLVLCGSHSNSINESYLSSVLFDISSEVV